jgi:hypothetical protein
LPVIVGFFLGSFGVHLMAGADKANASAEQQLTLDDRRCARAHICSYVYPCISLVINCSLLIVNVQKDVREIVGGGLIGVMSGAGLAFLYIWNELASTSFNSRNIYL